MFYWCGRGRRKVEATHCGIRKWVCGRKAKCVNELSMDMEEFLKAGSVVPTLAGVKFTHNNLEEGSRCLKVNGGQFTVLLGNDQLISAGFFVGFDSLIATTLNMFAPFIAEMRNDLNNNRVNEAQSKQQRLITAIDTIIKHGNWVPCMKEAMYLITGFDFGEAREPQGNLTAAQVKQMRADLTALHWVK